jgi:AcrR family transcriptional regulator
MRLISQGKKTRRSSAADHRQSRAPQDLGEAMGSRREVMEEHLLRIAAHRFASAGYRQTTLEEIARQAGVAKASMYRYFESKQELLAKMFIKVTTTLASRIEPLLTVSLAPEEKLRRAVQELVRAVGEHVALFTVFYGEEADLPPRLHAEITAVRQRLSANLERILAEGMEQGVFRQLNAKLLVYAITGMCAWLHKWYTPGEARLDDVMFAFVELVERGCRAPRGAQENERLADRLRHIHELVGELVEKADRLEPESPASEKNGP